MPSTPDIGDRSRETPAYDRSRETLACGSHPRFGQHPRFDRRRARLAAARLYLVCDSKPGGRDLADILPAAVAGGVDIVQLRDKQLSDEELTEVARAASTLCSDWGVLLIVNDRPHVAVDAGADGVHVGQDDMSVEQARRVVGPDILIGLSTHSPAELQAADPGLVDYIGVGPVHVTPTKPGRPAVGLELVRHAATNARVPFFAIGGIDHRNLPEAIEAGARRVAVVRAIANAADPEQAARALRISLDSHAQEDELAHAAIPGA